MEYQRKTFSYTVTKCNSDVYDLIYTSTCTTPTPQSNVKRKHDCLEMTTKCRPKLSEKIMERKVFVQGVFHTF